jgi:transposase
VLCYEAGRDGFWLQRACTAAGLTALVVDSSSIEVSRRKRRAKTDRLDATALLRVLLRHTAGERGQWRVLHVPTVEEEDRRHAHRELARLTRERTRGINQIKGLLAAHGIHLTSLRALPDQVPHLTQWDGRPLPSGVRERLLTTWTRLTLALSQRAALVRARRAVLEQSSDPAVAMVRQLVRLRGVGEISAWLLTMELFSWRRFRNRREVAGIMGLTATPSSSGDRRREQGIGKGGSALLRGLAMELAWCWLRYQPTSELSQWYRTRFALGGSRQRRIGIVALARRLMIALWRYVETGRVPTGATMKA